MEITTEQSGPTLTLHIAGRLDAVSAELLETRLNEVFAGEKYDLVFELSGLVYISSIGLRLILVAEKKSHAAGTAMKLIHLTPEVRSVFDMTGFTNFLTIE